MQDEPGIPRRCSIFPGRAPHPPRPSRRWGAGAALVALAAVLGIATPEDARAQGGAHPGRPQNFTATAGDTQVVLSWTAPADEGGTPIIAYQYRAAVGATVPESYSWIQLDGADSREATVPGLTNGTQYAFEVRALNSSGTDAGPVAGPVATATATPVADITLTWDAREAGLEPSFTLTITFVEAVEGFTLDDISVTAINISDLPEEPGAFHQWELPAENFQTISATTYSVKVTPVSRTITIGPVGNRTPRTLQPQRARVTIPANAAQATNGETPKRETPKKRTVTDISLTLTVPPVTGTEREALTAFYHATDGPNWTDSTNWLDDDMELGEWHGVTTNTDGEVTRLILSRNNLRGSLPAELGNLRKLTRLYLHQNALSGAIPPELGHLRNLRLLLLHQNALSGAIPPELGLLENLTHLYLRQNTLSGAIPPKLGDLSKLQRLYLQGNDLSGAIPPELGLSSLVDLKLHSNADLSGPLPAIFPTAMPTLKELGMQNTGVTIPDTQAFADWSARITSGTQTSDGVITLDAANTRPSGLWADETTLYVVGEVGGKVYAYTLADGGRDTAKDITLDAANLRPTGLWSDGTTLYVLNYHIDNGADDGKIYAYTLADGGRDTDKDIIGPVSAGYGLWGRKDATCTGRQARCLIWVARSDQTPINLNAYRIYADADATPPAIYGSANTNFGKTLPTGDLLDIQSWVSGFWWKDPEPGGDSPTVWISDFLDAGLYAYSANPRAVEFSRDIVPAVEQNRILAPANLNPTALWSDGETWWVADSYAGQVFVYGPSAPPGTGTSTGTSTDATLRSLTLEDASDDSAITISPVFAAGTTSYTAVVDNDVDEITIKPIVNESNATFEYLDSSDTEITDADSGKTGQQVSLSEGTNTIKVKVTAGDTTTPNTYTVVVTRAAAVPGAANVLVSNAGQSSNSSNNSSVDRAQAFTTVAGATLSSVEIISSDPAGDDLAVSLCTTDSSGHPTSSCTALTAPASFAAGTLVFTDPASTTLAANTTYSLLLVSPGNDFLNLSVTSSDAEDTGGAAGWTIANAYDSKSGTVWGTTASDTSFLITIKGTLGTTTTTPPDAPTGLTATANGQSQIDLAWAAPANTGGSPITGYRIEVSPNGSSSWSDRVANTESTATTYAHTGLNAATTRHYRVSAINDVGTSVASISDDATTEAAPPPPPAVAAGRRSSPSTPPPPPDDVVGYLENPGAASFQSGIGLISGWTCDAEAVEIVLNGEPQDAAYGTARLDTEAVCGDSDNGFGLLFNWNLLGDGEHEVVALVDGVELDRATVTVTTLGTEFLRDVTGRCTAADFPTMDETVTLAWQQTQQNFVIAEGAAPASTTNRAGTPGVGYLENPGPNSFQSGIGVLSGWACEGTEVIIELNGQPQPAAYGTERLDTLAACGDTANGFGLLFNWNLLGEGEHEVVAFVDSEELGRTTVRVTTLGAEFVRDVEGECTVEDFPMLGETVTLEWQQNSQNFVITEVE